MPDYSRSKIYRIRAEGIDGCYVGATTRSLDWRIDGHKYRADCSSKAIMESGNAVIELIEDFPCNSKAELDIRERYWIENTPDVVNKRIPGRSKAEWYDENNDVILEKKRHYYETNRTIILEKFKQNFEANRDAINERRRNLYARKKAEKQNISTL